MVIEPSPEQDQIARQIVDSAITVHSTLGPGLLESVYEECLGYELSLKRLSVRRQIQQPIIYKGVKLNAGFRIDMLVGENVVVEVKSVDRLAAIHDAQLLTYLRLSGYRLGLLLNFNSTLMKSGIRRIIRPL